MLLNRRVSRAGEKLAAALEAWRTILPPVCGIAAADFGSNVGGFVQCLLAEGVVRVYAIDTGYGVLDWTLRNDARVIVMERTNALHVKLPEQVDLVTVDTAWTRQQLILQSAWRVLKPDGIYQVTFANPFTQAVDDESWDGEGYRLRVGRWRVMFDVREALRIIEVEEVKKRDEHTY